jgi:hypothetical protein
LRQFNRNWDRRPENSSRKTAQTSQSLAKEPLIVTPADPIAGRDHEIKLRNALLLPLSAIYFLHQVPSAFNWSPVCTNLHLSATASDLIGQVNMKNYEQPEIFVW